VSNRSRPLDPSQRETQRAQCCQVAEIPAKKLKKGSRKKKFVAEFWLILPKTGRKGAAENFQKSSLFLAVITTYNVHQDKIKFDF
jgi:hypothetical protein